MGRDGLTPAGHECVECVECVERMKRDGRGNGAGTGAGALGRPRYFSGLEALYADSDLLRDTSIGDARGLKVGKPAALGLLRAELPLATVRIADILSELRALAAD